MPSTLQLLFLSVHYLNVQGFLTFQVRLPPSCAGTLDEKINPREAIEREEEGGTRCLCGVIAETAAIFRFHADSPEKKQAENE